MTADDLKAFTARIADQFNAAHIRAPVHLDDGNEEQLIRYFQSVGPTDWVCCSWRAHYKCLLRGVPPEDLERQILAGRSISLCFPQYRVLSSAMVGGNLPIAIGIAMGIQRAACKNDPFGERFGKHVHCFVGDMTSLTGQFHECLLYAQNMDLPITFIVEDNDKSVCTPTRKVWGQGSDLFARKQSKVYQFSYESRYPHAGAGQRVNF